jgi:ribulose 1,5-bisphosphate carboxylase large subunit-like protein
MATLKEHEKLCEERYKSVEHRLQSLESKIDKVIEKTEDFKTFLIEIAIKSAIGIFALVCGAVFVIKI